jgi:hypothetical protein
LRSHFRSRTARTARGSLRQRAKDPLRPLTIATVVLHMAEVRSDTTCMAPDMRTGLLYIVAVESWHRSAVQQFDSVRFATGKEEDGWEATKHGESGRQRTPTNYAARRSSYEHITGFNRLLRLCVMKHPCDLFAAQLAMLMARRQGLKVRSRSQTAPRG